MDQTLSKIAHNALWFTSSESHKKALSIALASKDGAAIERETRNALRHVKNPKVRKKLEDYLKK
jgi:hypothetical protein